MPVKHRFQCCTLTGSSRWWGWGRSADSRQTEAHCARRRGSWWHMERTDAFLTGWEKQTRLVPGMFGNGASFTRRVTPRRVCVCEGDALCHRAVRSVGAGWWFWGDSGMETELALSSPETPGCHWAEDGTITPPSAHFWIKGPHWLTSRPCPLER